MAATVHILTTLAMLTHSILGCCWHHDHAETCGIQHGLVAADHDHDGHCRQHAGIEGPCKDDARDHACPGMRGTDEHDSPCDQAECTFIKSKPPALNVAPLTLPLVSARCVGIAAVDPRFAAEPDERCCRPRDSAVAVCAQLQVWLI